MKAIKAVNSLPTKAAVSDVRRQRRARTGLRHCGHQYSGKVCCSMVNGGFFDVHLLHDAGKVSIAMHGAAAAGTETSRSVLLEVSDLFGREEVGVR